MTAGFKGVLVVVLLLIAQTALSADRPRVAIVIDDMGFQQHRDQVVMEMDQRLTIAIIPESPLAGHLSRQAHHQGREVLVHLPLSGLVKDNCEPTLTCVDAEWSPDRMESHLAEAFRQVHGAVGINNHQGSRFTSDRRAVANLVAGLHRLEHGLGRSLVVLDSRTSPTTVFESKAREAGLLTARRHVFLDHSDRIEDIERAWDDLIVMARTRGQAVAIGHPRINTLDVLERRLPEIESQGVKLVTLTELVCPARSRELVGLHEGCQGTVRPIRAGAYDGLAP
jgi:uncharacterized protein